MFRIIGRILFKIILLPIKLVVILLEFALTALSAVILAGGSVIGMLTGAMGTLVLVAAVLSLFFGSHSMAEFWRYILISIGLTAVPAAIAAIGVEGIGMLKELLYNVLYL